MRFSFVRPLSLEELNPQQVGSHPIGAGEPTKLFVQTDPILKTCDISVE